MDSQNPTKNENTQVMDKAFMMLIYIAILFIIPALGGVLAVKFWNFPAFITLLGTFVFSWILVILLYFKYKKDIKKLE